MYIRTTGKPTKILLKTCKDAVKFYGKFLLSDILYHKINLKINFQQFDRKNKDVAYCEWEFENHLSRDFIITLDKNLNRKQILLALAHEMVHLKQYAKGELKDYVRVNSIKWKNQIIKENEIDYWFQPWEIEAHGMEKGLYVKFIEHMKGIK